MKYCLFNSGRLQSSLFAIVFLLLTALTGHGWAQAVPAVGGVPLGDTNPADQPLVSQQLGSNLTLNQNVNALSAENEQFNKYGLGLQAEGGAQTNFFGTRTDQQTVGYMSFLGDAALNLRSPRTRYYALYQPKYNVYPQYTRINNFGQSLFSTLNHALTEHFGLGWDLTANRSFSLDQFLPQTLGIGGIGIVVPNLQSLLLQNSFQATNAATSLRLRYLMSARWTLSASLTGAYFLTVPSHLTTPATGLYSQRYLSAGADLRLDYQWTPRDSLGAELTPVYVDGLGPKGHLIAETLQATYKRQLTATTAVSAAGGPLFFQTSIPGFGSSEETSYAINASISRQIRQSQFTAGYARAFVVSFLSPAIASNQGSVSAYVPFGHQWLLTAAGSYTHEGSGNSVSGVSLYGGSIGGGSAQMAYLLGTKTQLYALYSFSSQDFSYGQPQSYTFNQNKFGAGIRFNLGNPTTFGGTL